MGQNPSLFRDSNFMKLWTGQSISVFGAQFSPIAIQAIAVKMLGATSFQLGLLGFLNTISFLVLGLFVGVWVDRHRRRRIMILADIGRSATLLLIPAAALLYGITLNLLYLVTLVAGILTLFFEISYQSYVPSLVNRSQIVEANGKLETTRSSAQAVGPSVAGFAASISAPLAVLGDTFGYLASSISLLLIRKEETTTGPSGRKSTWHDIREGLSVVFGDNRLRAIAATTATLNLFASAWGAILFKYILQNLGMSLTQAGLAFGIGSLGGVVGALVALRLTRRFGVGTTIVLGAAISGAPAISLYFALPATVFVMLATVIFFTSFGALIYNIPQVSFRQALVPQEIQGRMNATMRTIVWGTLPLGSLLGGVVGQFIGIQTTIGVMTVLNSVGFLWVLLSPVRAVRDFPRA